MFYRERSFLLTRENVSISVYIVLHMLKREGYVTLRVGNWHFMQIIKDFFFINFYKKFHCGGV